MRLCQWICHSSVSKISQLQQRRPCLCRPALAAAPGSRAPPPAHCYLCAPLPVQTCLHTATWTPLSVHTAACADLPVQACLCRPASADLPVQTACAPLPVQTCPPRSPCRARPPQRSPHPLLKSKGSQSPRAARTLGLQVRARVQLPGRPQAQALRAAPCLLPASDVPANQGKPPQGIRMCGSDALWGPF